MTGIFKTHEIQYFRKRADRDLMVPISEHEARLYYIKSDSMVYYDHYSDDPDFLIPPELDEGCIIWNF